MGRYINKTSKELLQASFYEKCNALENDGAIPINRPKHWDYNLVVVVNNGPFAAAAYCFSPHEFERMTDPRDTRYTQWYIWDKAEQYAE